MKKLLTGFFAYWNGLFFPKKKGNIDWKSVGQLRARLNKMKSGVVSVPPVYATQEMARGFNLLNKRVSDREGLARWYGQGDKADAEQKLHQKIEAGQKVISAMKQSGQFPAILPEEADALRLVHQRYISPSPSLLSAEDKVASFLSGQSDNINDLLFSEFSGMQTAPSLRYLTSQPDDTVQDIPVITDEMIAALEKSMSLDALAQPADRNDETNFLSSASELDLIYPSNLQVNTSSNVVPNRESKKSRKKKRSKSNRNITADRVAQGCSGSNALKRDEGITGAKEFCPVAAPTSASVHNELQVEEPVAFDPLDNLKASNVTLFRPRVRVQK